MDIGQLFGRTVLGLVFTVAITLMSGMAAGEVRNDGALRLTTPPGSSSDQNPGFSPDGATMVFTRFEQGYNHGPGGLFLLDPATGATTRLTEIEDQDNVNLPGTCWNPVNDRILFASDREEADDIWRIAPDTSDFSRITTHSGSPAYVEPSWSPDGKYIVYSSNFGDLPTPNIFIVPSGGGVPQRVTRGSINEDGAPSWSPDGDWIAFESHVAADEEMPAALWQITAPATQTTGNWPEWAHSARLAGAAFELEMTAAEIDAKLDQLASDGVSVVVVDGPTGWSYTAWTRDEEFDEVLTMMRDEVFPRAHQRGLKVVWYLTSLELICSECVGTSLDPGLEHPEWLQIDRFGQPVEFSGVQGVFWLEEDDYDVWLSPESSYREFYLDRIRQIATAGADALWMDVAYLLNGLGQFEDLWPSTDPFSQAAFEAATGHQEIPEKDWEDLAWRHWVRWRMGSVAGFVRAVADAGHEVDPDLLFFTENWCMDSTFSVQYAQDPMDFPASSGVATAHELEPIDQDHRGMLDASLEDWQDYVLLVKFAGASNRDRPAWVLTYAGAIDDSLREAAVHLAEGACFYEAKGPEMLDDTTGSRPTVFPWIEANSGTAYGSRSLADVALYFSPRSRDFIDGEESGDDKFDEGDTTYFKEYRLRGRNLLSSQIPFDIVGSSWSAEDLARYRFLVLPGAACLSNDEAATLRAFAAAGGRIASSGEVGTRDEWCVERSSNALDGIAMIDPSGVSSEVVETSLRLNDRPRVLVEIRSGTDADGQFLFIGMAKLRGSNLEALGVSVTLPEGFSPDGAVWSVPGRRGEPIEVTLGSGRLNLTVPTLETGATVVVRGAVAGTARRPSGGRSPAPSP